METLKSVGKRLFRYFLAGAFAILPLVVTIAIERAISLRRG